MSSRIIITDNGEPVLQPGEKFIISQFGVKFHVESGGGYPGSSVGLYGEGNMYLTNRRLVVTMVPPTDISAGFEMPLVTIFSEKVTSPMFGSTKVSGGLKLGSDEVADWSVWFLCGGAEEMFASLQRALELPRSDPEEYFKQIEESMEIFRGINPMTMTNFAYIDPQDPSSVFLPNRS